MTSLTIRNFFAVRPRRDNHRVPEGHIPPVHPTSSTLPAIPERQPRLARHLLGHRHARRPPGAQFNTL